MFVEDKVFWIGNIAENLRSKVMELEVQVTPSTPLEVLEERIKVAIESTKRIKEEK